MKRVTAPPPGVLWMLQLEQYIADQGRSWRFVPADDDEGGYLWQHLEGDRGVKGQGLKWVTQSRWPSQAAFARHAGIEVTS